jgi:aminoglycoside 2'-N-acetyltransferase I
VLTTIRRVPTPTLTTVDVERILALMDAAFDPNDPDEVFSEEDWRHASGGTHVLVEVDGALVSHAAVVERELRIAGGPFLTGYVEAVATAPSFQGRGHGTAAMGEIAAILAARFDLGALGTGRHGFYERLGWETWRGPSSVRSDGGEVPTPDDDGFIMILRTPRTPAGLDLGLPISCDWRPGAVW